MQYNENPTNYAELKECFNILKTNTRVVLENLNQDTIPDQDKAFIAGIANIAFQENLMVAAKSLIKSTSLGSTLIMASKIDDKTNTKEKSV